MHYIYRYTFDTIVEMYYSENVSKYVIALSEYSQVQFTGLIPPFPGVLGHRTFFSNIGQKCGHFLNAREAKR